MVPLFPYTSFETASTEVMHYLHSRLGFQLWMVTRTQSNDWIVLNAHDNGYSVQKGDVFRWTDSFCSRMVEGLGPRIAPRSDDIQAYAEAPIGQQVPIGSYVGVPLTRHDGSLFGTLCAIDPEPMPDEISTELPLVELMARMLTTIMENELKAHREHRRAERALHDAMSDKLTGLFNRRGWETLLAKEYRRCQRYGHSSCMLSIDLDGLKSINDGQGHARGDELICRAANAMRAAARDSDVVARVGGDEFAILLVECDLDSGQKLVRRFEKAFAKEKVAASIGMAVANPKQTFEEIFDEADKRMYENKIRRKEHSELQPQPEGLPVLLEQSNSLSCNRAESN